MNDFDVLQKKLDKGLIPATVLLSRAKVYNEEARASYAMTDNRHFPFYYYLGQLVEPRNVLQIGPYFGLPAMCFMQTCKTIESWYVIGERNSLVESNLRMFCESSALILGMDSHFLNGFIPDMCLLSQQYERLEMMDHLNFLWSKLEDDGLLVVDYISTSDAFREFCRVKNRTPATFKTRYGVGIVQK